MESSHNEKGGLAYNWVIVNDDSTNKIKYPETPLHSSIPNNESNKEDDSDSTITASHSSESITAEDLIKELFVQYYFQCVLSSDIVELREKYELLLIESCNSKKYSNIDFIQYVVKLCLQNRDIKRGKGLTNTTHMMLNTIAYYCYEKNVLEKNLFVSILKSFVCDKYNEVTNKKEHPYGSWKDIKYFLNYFLIDCNYEYKNVTKMAIIDDIIKKIYIPQMIKDRKKMSVQEKISLCGKWLPRESGKFKIIARKIAIHYHNEVYKFTEKRVNIYQNYRQLISKFNKYLDTTQIHMTSNNWDKIDFENVTSKTLFLNKSSFLNEKNIDSVHRNICKENFKQFISDKEKNGNYLKNNNTVMPHKLVQNVIQNYNNYNSADDSMALINMQWNGLMKTLENEKFMEGGNCYPCIDVSPSMMSDNAIPLYCAIGLGLACSHLFNHNRAFTFSSDPEWIQYDENESFVDRVYKTINSGWGSTTNIHKLFKRILHTCLNKENDGERVPQSEIDKTCLIIFSDMQFDVAEDFKEDMLFDVIRKEYKDAGYNNIPFLIFWNLRTTNTFPTIEKNKNMIQLSGNSTCLLEIFMKTSLDDFKKLGNWDILKQILDNTRYII
tara:strand:+ start:3801 stop:5630 length:1830 start_codon:yes stop_codon:yes gene_type:complete